MMSLAKFRGYKTDVNETMGGIERLALRDR